MFGLQAVGDLDCKVARRKPAGPSTVYTKSLWAVFTIHVYIPGERLSVLPHVFLTVAPLLSTFAANILDQATLCTPSMS